ncbi:hypothetical protein EI94DRAFT_1105052 [Lactarius quietus]|nr:hypothetical protein EI94DRAFT_1105052 [Lactarius quietus]
MSLVPVICLLIWCGDRRPTWLGLELVNENSMGRNWCIRGGSVCHFGDFPVNVNNKPPIYDRMGSLVHRVQPSRVPGQSSLWPDFRRHNRSRLDPKFDGVCQRKTKAVLLIAYDWCLLSQRSPRCTKLSTFRMRQVFYVASAIFTREEVADVF